MSIIQEFQEMIRNNDVEMCNKIINESHFDYKDFLPIHTSIWGKNYNMTCFFIQKVKEKGICQEELNRYDGEGFTPLYVASAQQDHDLCKLLIKNGADIDKKDMNYGVSPLHLACCNQSVKIVNLLLYHGADMRTKDYKGITPLDDLVRLNNDLLLEMFIEEYRRRESKKEIITVKYMLSDDLDKATIENDYFSCDYIIKNNPTAILEEYPLGIPLYLSCKYGHMEIFCLFTGRIKSLNIDKPFKNGNTLLHAACYSGNIDLCNLLIEEYNANVNSENDMKQTPIIVASIKGYYKICKLLQKKRANVYHKDNNEKSSIDYTFICSKNFTLVN